MGLESSRDGGAGSEVEEEDVLELLSKLVDKSLVVVEASGEGGVRYRMLEPVRQYARGKLKEGGEIEAVLRRHATFFLSLAEKAKPELLGLQQAKWLHRLEREHDNLRATLSWALERKEGELALRMGVLCGGFGRGEATGARVDNGSKRRWRWPAKLRGRCERKH